jgi:hypothetical protein
MVTMGQMIELMLLKNPSLSRRIFKLRQQIREQGVIGSHLPLPSECLTSQRSFNQLRIKPHVGFLQSLQGVLELHQPPSGSKFQHTNCAGNGETAPMRGYAARPVIHQDCHSVNLLSQANGLQFPLVNVEQWVETFRGLHLDPLRK